MAALLPQAPAADPVLSPIETWKQVQERYNNAGIIDFRAEARILSTHPAFAGRTIAKINADVEVARSGLGAIDLTVVTGCGPQAKTARLASLGTDEGVFSVDCALNLAYPCGNDWAASGELDDFAFLGPNWSGAAARAGEPVAVNFVPTHAEHPGLNGLRVQWKQAAAQPAFSTIFWIDHNGFVSAADVRLDPETVVHWTFSNCTLRDEATNPLQPVALPAGCVRNSGQPVEANAQPAPAPVVEDEPVIDEDPIEEEPENDPQV